MTYKLGYDNGWRDGRKALLEEQKAARKAAPCRHEFMPMRDEQLLICLHCGKVKP